jgi:hypothetical protein
MLCVYKYLKQVQIQFFYIWNFTDLYLFPALDNDPQLITY